MSIVTKRSAMTLFSDPRDQYSHRVRLVLAEKGVTVDIVDIVAGKEPEDLAELNPYNTLPTLADRDLALYEANVITEYLDERFPHPPLLPVYPVQRALSRLWISRVEKEWSSRLDLLMLGKGRETVLSKARKELRESIIAIAPIFAEKPLLYERRTFSGGLLCCAHSLAFERSGYFAAGADQRRLCTCICNRCLSATHSAQA